jgi:hypothetical protein
MLPAFFRWESEIRTLGEHGSGRGKMTANKRYLLLLYKEWMRSFSIPTLSIAIILIVLWAGALTGLLPEHMGVARSAQTLLLGIAALVALGLWLIVALLPRVAFVQCRPDYLMIRLGFLRLIVSYARVRTSRTVQHGQIHNPASQPRSRRALATRMALKQCVMLELTSYPMAFFLLRAMTHPFLFLGEEPGFLFAVDDWMGLGREVEEMHSAWLAKRKDAGKQPRLGALS